MVRTLLKSALREIRQSLGRYLAILAIIALGVGFFSGLRLCQPAMMATGIDYVTQYKLFDFQLMSTLGYTEEDVAAFAALDGVSGAWGSVYTDFLMEAGDEEVVITARALTEGVNDPELAAGRMPEAANECLGDARYFTEEDLGTQVAVSPNNDEDTLDLLAYDSYTLVGLMHSPYYLNYERGTSSIGSGSVTAFIYLPEEGFDFEAYYEIYLTIADPAEAWSDAYDDQIDGLTDQVEDLARERADQRYDDIYDDALAEIEDAEQEIADGWEEYRAERADAEQELADAHQELLDGEQELADARADYEQGQIDYADGVQKLEDAEQEIADGEQELQDGWQEYYDGKAEAEQELRDAYQELVDAEEEYADGLAEYEDGLRQLQDAEEQYQEGAEALEDAEAEIEAGWRELEDAREQLEEGEEQLQQLQTLYQSGETMAASISQMVPGAPVMDAGSLVSYLQNGTSDDPLYAAIYAALDAALQGQGSSVEEFVGGWQAAEAALGGPLNAASLAALQTQLEEGWIAYEDGLDEYYAGLDEYEAGLEELEASREQLDDAGDELDDAKDQLDEGRAELDDGWREYYDGAAEAEQELADAYQELMDGEQELADARQELEDGRAELEDAAQELADAPGQIADAEQELADGWAEYNDGVAEAEQEFADAEQELHDAEDEVADARIELEDLEEADVYVLTRNENTGYVCFENDTSIIAAISLVFPVFFFLVAALVCMTTMTRMVDEERTQIGVLKALGYSNGQIMSKYLFYSGSAAVIGSVTGYAAGSWFLPWVIWEIYGIMYGFAPLEYIFNPALALVAFGAALLCSMGATWLSCRAELRKAAAELIRPKSPKAGKRVFLEYIKPLWRRLSFLHKVSVRNVLRYRSRLIMMVLGIGGCTALLITGFGIRDSITSIVDDQFDEITLYDYSVTFQAPRTEEDVADFLADCGWEEGLLVHSGSADVVADNGSRSVYLVISSTGSLDGYIDLHSGDTAIDYPGPGEVVVNTGLAENLGLAVGDTIQLRDEELGALTVTISGICDNYVSNYVYVAAETYQQQLGQVPDYKTLYLHAHEGADPYAEGSLLSDGVSVSRVTVNEATRTQVDDMLGRLDYIVIVIVLCAAALAFIVLYNLTNINITERVREIATIKVLGFYPNEVASYVFREIGILSVLGSLAGLLMGKALHAFVLAQVQIDAMYFPSWISPASYLVSVGLTLLFSAVIALGMRPRLGKVDMAESLKSIE